MKPKRSKITTSKKSKTKRSKPKITKAEQFQTTMRLLRIYAPLCGKNKLRLAALADRSISLINRYFRRKDFKDIKDYKEKMRQPKAKASTPPRVPFRYNQPNETPLRVEVQPGSQVIDFEIKADDIEIKLLGAPAR